MSKQLKGVRDACYVERPPFPVNMIVEVTNACNHACIFCAHGKMCRRVGMMDLELYKNIAAQAYEHGTREIGFYMTGEPLMNVRLADFVAYAKALGFEYIYITTNGALAGLDIMKKLMDAGLNSIKFSINAGCRETYRMIHGRDDFDTVIGNLKALSAYIRASRPQVGLFVSYIVCRQNQGEKEMLQELIGQDVDQLRFADAYNQGGNMYEINEGIMLDRDYRPMAAPCSMIFNRLHITWEGYLNACCVDFENNLAAADLNKVSLEEAWYGPEMTALRRMHLANEIPRDIMCYNCIRNENHEIRKMCEL